MPVGQRSVAVLAALLCVAMVVGTTSPAPARKRHSKRHGFLRLQCGTEGAEVFVDSESVGTVPLAKRLRLKVGKHTLKITKQGFTQFLDVVNVRPRRTTTLEIDLLPMAGVLKVTASIPEALVHVDGQFVGTTPLETEVLVGRRAIRISKAGYYDVIATVKAVGGSALSTHAVLRPLPVGSSPYRPAPPPPDKWYEKWYVWAGAAAGVTAVALGIIVPVLVMSGDPVDDFDPDFRFRPEE